VKVTEKIAELLKKGYEPMEVVRMGYKKSTVYKVYHKLFGPRRIPKDNWTRQRIINTLKYLMHRIDEIERTLSVIVNKQMIMNDSIDELIDSQFVKRRRK